MKRILNNIIHFFQQNKSLSFWLLLISISIFYQYQRIIVLRPQSVHRWRQTDCASQALNFSQNGMNFFKPEIHNQVADNLTTGYCAEEFPLIYYIVAVFYKIFGFHEWIYRLTSILIFFLGLFALFKICQQLFKKFTISAFIAGILFLSPMFVFYANNFTTNTSSFAIVLIGWYYFFLFRTNTKSRNLFIAIGLFAIASLIKISEAMSLFTIAGIYIAESFGIIRFDAERRIFPKRIFIFLLFLFAFLIIASWYFYASYYNNLHNQIYYNFVIHPIWMMDSQAIADTWSAIKNAWFPDYFHYSIFILILLSIIGNIVFFNKSNRFLIFVSLILFIGSICYLLLWFENLKDHDYYTISVYIFFIFSLLSFADIVYRHYPKIVNSLVFKFTLIFLVVINIILTRNNFTGRYDGWQNDIELYKDLQTVTPFMRSLGISRFDKVICFPDQTVNYSLYLMNQPGWTSLYNWDQAENIKTILARNAKYLVLLGEPIKQLESIKPYMYHPIGIYGNVSIFKLDGIINNHEVKEYFAYDFPYVINCDAEKYLPEKHSFSGSNNSEFISENLQTNEKSHSGQYSVKINAKHAFTMDIRFPGVKARDKYKISVWRYPKDAHGTIVASIKSPDEYYKCEYKSERTDENGWELISLEISIPEKMNNENMGIDLWYYANDSANCYLDDLQIQHFKEKP